MHQGSCGQHPTVRKFIFEEIALAVRWLCKWWCSCCYGLINRGHSPMWKEQTLPDPHSLHQSQVRSRCLRCCRTHYRTQSFWHLFAFKLQLCCFFSTLHPGWGKRKNKTVISSMYDSLTLQVKLQNYLLYIYTKISDFWLRNKFLISPDTAEIGIIWICELPVR